MRNVIYVIVSLIIVSLSACNGKKPVEEPQTLPQLTEGSSVQDSTIYGRCGESTAMHVVEIILNNGDTMRCSINTDDTINVPDVVRGGLFVGDRLAATATKTADGSFKATRVINLTTLTGTWTAINRQLTIEEDGTVTGSTNEPHPYTTWRIINGRLLLPPDTFDIYSLGADSLWLEDDKGIYEYRRMR